MASQIAAPLSHVTQLFLGKNKISDAGVTSFVAAWAAAARVQRLSLLNNMVGDIGARAIGAWLATNPTRLEALNLSHNAIGNAGVAALTVGAEQSLHARTVDVGRNPCSRAVALALHETMSRECVRQRQHRAFRAAARLLLLARTSGSRRAARGDGEVVEEEPLCKLPHVLMQMILELACPEQFKFE